MEERYAGSIWSVTKVKYKQSYTGMLLREHLFLVGGIGEDFTEEVAFKVMCE